MATAHPYLNFQGNTEEAIGYYAKVLGVEPVAVVRFRDFPDNPMAVPEADLDRIAHMSLPLGNGVMLMATDALESRGDIVKFGNNSYIMLAVDSADEAERIFNELADGGQVEMPMMATEWAEKYGICADRFGVQWMVGYEGEKSFTVGHT